MMPRNSNSRPVTALSNFLGSAEPISEEDRKRLADKWVKKRLDEIYDIANINEDIARNLCEKAVECAYGNSALTTMIKVTLTRKKGRPSTTLPDWLYLLRYAYEMRESNGNRKEARRKFIGFLHNKDPKDLQDELIKDMTPSLENRISEKIAAYRNGKLEIPLDDNKLPAWAEDVIQKRIARGKKNKRRN